MNVDDKQSIVIVAVGREKLSRSTDFSCTIGSSYGFSRTLSLEWINASQNHLLKL